MSEKFGLDWKNYDNERTRYFMAIMVAEADRTKRENNTKNNKYGRHITTSGH